jgi:hypothetical protein
MPEHPRKALLNMEKEMTGVYISGHPLDEVADLLQSGFTSVLDVQNMAENENHGLDHDGDPAVMAGILAMAKSRITKRGAMMGIVTLEDLTGQIEGLVFPKIYEQFVDLLAADNLVVLTGKLSFREEEAAKLLVDGVQLLNPQTAQQARMQTRVNVSLAADSPDEPPAARSDWTHDPQKPCAHLSEANAGMMNAYPGADTETQVDESLFTGAPRLLPDAPPAPGAKASGGEWPPAAQTASAETADEARPAAAGAAERRLTLTLPTREPYYEQVKALLGACTGDVPAYVTISDEALSFPLAREYWPAEDAALNDRRRELLGRANVLWSA